MRRVLVLRPEPGATRTAAAARAAGLEAIVAPLFAVRAVAWELPERLPDAVLLTSANAARLGGAGLAALTHLPAYAVGAATAEAAREAGFTRIVVGDEDVASVAAKADGTTLLHLAGREHRPIGAADTRIVYAADAVPALPEAARAALPGAVALLHSPRAAARFAALAGDRTAIAIAAISRTALAAAGNGWRAVAIADSPTDAALLAAASGLCDQEH